MAASTESASVNPSWQEQALSELVESGLAIDTLSKELRLVGFILIACRDSYSLVLSKVQSYQEELDLLQTQLAAGQHRQSLTERNL